MSNKFYGIKKFLCMPNKIFNGWLHDEIKNDRILISFWEMKSSKK